MRCAKVEEIINLLDYNTGNQEVSLDFLKLKETIKELITIFGQTSKCEIEVLIT